MAATHEAILANLTNAQRAAVTHRDGALLVLAGPGSGKTTVVTHRMAHLIAGGVPPWQILALTFTNKAAGEMGERMAAMLPGRSAGRGGPTVATFHSFCARQLRQFAEAADLAPRYSIYDDADQREAIKQAMKQAEVDSTNFTPSAIGAAISNAKNRLLDAHAYAAQASGFREGCITRVYSTYEKILRANDALDFDDLLLRMVRLLRTDEQVRTQLQQRYHYLLIDEYQDTNHAQFVIAHTLAASHGNICVVGDPDQSIYGWRGADISNILEFEQQYSMAKVVPLGQNFRSTGHIVDAAAGLIEHNKRRKSKRLYTELGPGERPAVVICRDEQHEAVLVADFLRGQSEQHGVVWKEMAVLYRVNALSRVLEEALRTAEIPYVIARGTAFYDRKEIKDALAYLRVIANPNDEVSLRRIINTPSRGIGKTTLKKVELFAIDGQLRLLEALRRAGDMTGLTARAVNAITKFVQMLEGCRKAAVGEVPRALAGSEHLARLVEQVIRESGLESAYQQSPTEEDQQRLANLEELISAAAQFVAPPADEQGPKLRLLDLLTAFLESVALVSDADLVDPQRGTVTLMTLHTAKGLEFSAVAMIGLEENLLPHVRAADSDNELEEERRLCFVGITRAKRRLQLSRAALRTHRGIREPTIESRFLRELPAESIVLSDQAGEGARLDDERDGAVEFPVGSIVRHPKFGLGRVESIMPRAAGVSARVAFSTGGTKTLILDFAPLERVE
ncbi:MAG: ATP-dependent helicase [Phycisphaerales bacterium]